MISPDHFERGLWHLLDSCHSERKTDQSQEPGCRHSCQPVTIVHLLVGFQVRLEPAYDAHLATMRLTRALPLQEQSTWPMLTFFAGASTPATPSCTHSAVCRTRRSIAPYVGAPCSTGIPCDGTISTKCQHTKQRRSASTPNKRSPGPRTPHDRSSQPVFSLTLHVWGITPVANRRFRSPLKKTDNCSQYHSVCLFVLHAS